MSFQWFYVDVSFVGNARVYLEWFLQKIVIFGRQVNLSSSHNTVYMKFQFNSLKTTLFQSRYITYRLPEQVNRFIGVRECSSFIELLSLQHAITRKINACVVSRFILKED